MQGDCRRNMGQDAEQQFQVPFTAEDRNTSLFVQGMERGIADHLEMMYLKRLNPEGADGLHGLQHIWF